MKTLKRLSALILLFMCCGPAFCQAPLDGIIRIGILQKVKSFNLSCEGSYTLVETASGDKHDIAPLDDHLVKGSGSRILLDGKSYAAPVRIIVEADYNRVRVNGRRYRDNILVLCKEGKLTVINELGLENYIYGILTCEVSPNWHEESLKAQAVVSRTYALRNLRKHEAAGFDLCNQTHCQVFGGMESEDERTNAAVGATAGEVLVFEGKLAETLFHASCGGHTETPSDLWRGWKQSPIYLTGRKDKYCEESPHQTWKGVISEKTIRAKLNKAGYKVGKISKITVSGTNKSDRAMNIKVKHSGGTTTINAGKFRLAVDPWLIKSVMFTKISRDGDSFIFRGHGWGHGVGMCQWGAKVMAEQGHDYHEILDFYYPGAVIEKREE